MLVHVPQLNSVDLRSAGNPYSTDYGGYRYVRRYLLGDRLRLQLVLEGAGYGLEVESLLIREGGEVAGAIPKSNSLVAGGFLALDLLVPGTLGEGSYFIKVQLLNAADGTAVLLHSEPFCVVREMPQSVLVEVSHGATAFGVFFGTSAQPFTYRVEGGFYPASLTPESSDTIYEAQQAAYEQLYSMPYETRRLVLGGATGIPDRFIRKLNRALSCDALTLNGAPYGKVEGSKLEPSQSDRYPFRSWSIVVKEKRDPFAYGILEAEALQVSATWGMFRCEALEVTASWGDYWCEKLEVVASWGVFSCDAQLETATWEDYTCTRSGASELKTYDGEDVLTESGDGILVSGGSAVYLLLSKSTSWLSADGVPADEVALESNTSWEVS